MQLDEKTQKALNNDIIEKSQINKFTSVQIISAPVFDFKTLPDKEINRITVEPFTKIISVSTCPVSISATKEQIKDLDTFGIDVAAMINSVLANETALFMFKEFKNHLVEQSTKVYLKGYTKLDNFKVWLYKIFKKTYQKKIKVKSTKELIQSIVFNSQKIYSNSRRGRADYMICNGATAYLMTQTPSFSFEPINKVELSNGRPHLVGNIAGISVWVDPLMAYNDYTIYFGRKINNEDPGIKMYFYEKGMDLKNITNDETLAPKIILSTRYAIVPVGLYPEKQYSKIIYKPTKKMLK